MASITLPADAAARVLYNALLFADKKCLDLSEVHIEISGAFRATGCDRYTGGTDYAWSSRQGSFVAATSAYVPIAEATEFERRLREFKKQEVVISSLDRIFVEGTDLSAPTVMPASPRHWEGLAAMFASNDEQPLSPYHAFNPDRWRQWYRVKADGSPPMDVFMQSDYVWHLKIGRTFEGVLAPTDRALAIEHYRRKGEDVSALFWGIERAAVEAA